MLTENLSYSVPGWVFEAAKKYSEKIAFIQYVKINAQESESYSKIEISYGEFLTKTLNISQLLSKTLGVKFGDKVAICSESMPKWFAAYLAASALGAVCVPIDSELGESEIKNLTEASGAIVFFTGTTVKEKVQSALNGLNKTIIPFDSPDFMNAWESKTAPEFDFKHLPSNEDGASIIFTSGTTSKPKGVFLTHTNLCSDAKAAMEQLIICGSDNVLSVLPAHHTYPFMCAFFVPMLVGATVTYPPGLKGADLVKTIRDCRVTGLIGVPRLLEMFLNAIETKITARPAHIRFLTKRLLSLSDFLRRTVDINSGAVFFKEVLEAFGEQFRFITSGGAKLKPETMRRLEAFGFTVIEGYGLTETSPIVTFNPLKKRKAGSAGIPLNGVTIKTLKTPGKAADSAEILIKGPMVMKGYFGTAQSETDSVIKDGFFHTGDIGYIDSDGYLFITGRAKEVIVLSSGKNVYPEDVEAKYLEEPLIKEICVYEGNDERGAASLYALIVCDTDYAKKMKIPSIHESVKWSINRISTTLPPYMRLKGFQLWSDELPKTRLGKLQRYIIKEMVKTETVDRSSALQHKEEPTGQYALVVLKLIREITEINTPIGGSDNLELDLGFDSLRKIELIAAIEKRLKIRLPESVMSELQSVDSVIEAVSKVATDEVLQDQSETRAAKTGYSEMLKGTPDKSDLIQSGFLNKKHEDFIAKIMNYVLKTAFRIFFKAKLQGIENLPDTAYILCPNHCSYMDAFFVSACVPHEVFKNLFFQGDSGFFTGYLSSRFARYAHVIPIDPGEHLMRALTTSAYLLNHCQSLCIFPEGGRSVDGTLQEFKKGVGILAYECGVPLMPVLIRGAYDVLPRGAFLPKLHTVTVIFGKPVYPEKAADKNYQKLADEVKSQILTLMNIKR
ncbi:MAG: AMP-binding protein [Nitrospirae bacterium]|nr:AMP-binding protein [Nitrospirota bacterium]MBF0534669.1 AMP-binding protein [Nitrospirota bacterium]MBF0616287.1 AMP-binding protein [Nitrospirota bacterium]